ncbi:hypothetical protein N7513_003080 [Penicillium frequentans]|nr:hypothetical protein N7513_003080 [Penicillium glabrum]
MDSTAIHDCNPRLRVIQGLGVSRTGPRGNGHIVAGGINHEHVSPGHVVSLAQCKPLYAASRIHLKIDGLRGAGVDGDSGDMDTVGESTGSQWRKGLELSPDQDVPNEPAGKMDRLHFNGDPLTLLSGKWEIAPPKYMNAGDPTPLVTQDPSMNGPVGISTVGTAVPPDI